MTRAAGTGRDFELLTVREVAELLRLTPKGVYGLVETRRIPHVKMFNRIRFRRDELLRFIEQNRVSALEQFK